MEVHQNWKFSTCIFLFVCTSLLSGCPAPGEVSGVMYDKYKYTNTINPDQENQITSGIKNYIHPLSFYSIESFKSTELTIDAIQVCGIVINEVKGKNGTYQRGNFFFGKLVADETRHWRFDVTFVGSFSDMKATVSEACGGTK